MTAHAVDYYITTARAIVVRCECGWKGTASTLDAARKEHELHKRSEDRRKGTR